MIIKLKNISYFCQKDTIMRNMRFFIFLLPALLFTQSCNSSSSTVEADTVKLISFNIRNSYSNDKSNSWKYRKEAVVNFLLTEQPDVVGMQEICPDQLAYLAESLPQYKQVGIGRGDDNKARDEHMTVFYLESRYDLLDSGNFWLNETPDSCVMGWDAACYRLVTWVKLKNKNSGKTFYYFNTHFDHMGVTARFESSKLLANKVREIAGDSASVIAGGDLNESINNELFAPLKDYMADTRAIAPEKDSIGTYHNYGQANPFTAIDHLFSRNVEVISVHTLTGGYGVPYISDHYPVCLVFKLK